MKMELSAEEARVIGALLEKEIATPDQYPLSLNALTNACNQKSSHESCVALRPGSATSRGRVTTSGCRHWSGH